MVSIDGDVIAVVVGKSIKTAVVIKAEYSNDNIRCVSV